MAVSHTNSEVIPTQDIFSLHSIKFFSKENYWLNSFIFSQLRIDLCMRHQIDFYICFILFKIKRFTWVGVGITFWDNCVLLDHLLLSSFILF